jgi:hypothetical protein
MTDYLAELDEKKRWQREFLAARRLLESGFHRYIVEQLGLPALFSWYILEIRHERLVESFRGDVDILMGGLSWNDPGRFQSLIAENIKKYPDWPTYYHHYFAALDLAEAGGIKWPPSMDYLIGIEVKCAYLNPKAPKICPDEIKSVKSSKSKQDEIKTKLDLLLEMGLNKIALLDFIANPHASGDDGQAWLLAGEIAAASENAMKHKRALDAKNTVLEERLSDNSPIGHWVLSLGAVAGGDEGMRGAGMPVELRKAIENPLLQNSNTQTNRKQMGKNLGGILGSFAVPKGFPIILIDCRACRKIHSYAYGQGVCQSNK